jgi:hypothetical protein
MISEIFIDLPSRDVDAIRSPIHATATNQLKMEELMRRHVLVLVLTIAVVSCSDSVSTSRLLPADRPVVDFMNGPDSPGPIIARDDSDPFFLLVDSDAAAGLVSVIRLPAPGVTLIPCGGATHLDQSSLQLVTHASGAINQLMKGRGVHAFVYDRSSFFAALRSGGLCFAIETQVPVAGGLVDFNAHDNDTFLSGAHADAFGWSARGIMTSEGDGSSLRFLNTSHGVLASDGSLIHFSNKITLTPLARH